VVETEADVDRLVHTRRPIGHRVMLRMLPVHLGFAEGLPAAADRERFGVPVAGADLAGADLAGVVARIVDEPLLELSGLDVYLGSRLARFGGYARAISQLGAATPSPSRSSTSGRVRRGVHPRGAPAAGGSVRRADAAGAGVRGRPARRGRASAVGAGRSWRGRAWPCTA
jgi:hypothetical protein